MQYELAKTDEIILVLMKPKIFMKQQNKAAALKKWKTVVLAEKERIQQQFLQEIFNCGQENRIQCYVQQHQLALIKLADNLYHYLQRGTAESILDYPSLKQYRISYAEIFEQVEQLLHFIIEHFGRHCNFDLKIPDKLMAENIPAMKILIKKTRDILSTYVIDERLARITCYPIENFLLDNQPVSYQRFEFIRRYQKELNLFLGNNSISNEDVCFFLIKLNVNNTEFFNYYTHKLKENAEDSHTGTHSLIEYYTLQLKTINQLPRPPVPGYKPTLPGLHELIGNWLSEEIYYLEKKLQFVHPSHTVKQSDTAFSKVHTRLSVGHLSLALKLLLDTGVIKNKNITELMRMVARNFRTEKSEHISEDSLRNKVYNIESVAVKGMKDVIVGLLNEVRKY